MLASFVKAAVAALPLLLAAAAPAAEGAANLPPIPADKSTPIHQRLSLPAPQTVSVGWNTYEHLAKPCVHFGLSRDALTQTACSTSSVTYKTSRTWSNSVRIDGLKPATTYYYKIDSTNSTVDHFQSGRNAGDTTPFNMIALADLGVVGPDGYTLASDVSKRDIPKTDPSLQHTTIAQLAKTIDDWELVIHPGDIAYADDWEENPKNIGDGVNAYEAILEQFFTQLAPVSGRKPYLISPGNHEADCIEGGYKLGACPEGQYNFTDFMNRFGAISPSAFPSTSASAQAKAARDKARSLAVAPFWFSFDYGMVHVAMINTETDFADSPDGPGTTLDAGNFGAMGQQVAWLEADLASVDRSVTPWVIVAGHRPWYTTGGACKPCQAAFEKIIYTHGVDIAAFGHVHNLQRQAPVYNGTADPAGQNDPKAPLYLVVGGAGNIEGHSAITKPPPTNKFAYNKSFGYASLAFHNRTHMDITFINSVDGSVLDKSTLFKSHKDNFVRQ